MALRCDKVYIGSFKTLRAGLHFTLTATLIATLVNTTVARLNWAKHLPPLRQGESAQVAVSSVSWQVFA